MYNRLFYDHFCTKVSICYVRMQSISKSDCCADRSILALPSAYQEYLVTFKLMRLQKVQRKRPLRGHEWLLGRQRVKDSQVSVFFNTQTCPARPECVFKAREIYNLRPRLIFSVIGICFHLIISKVNNMYRVV